MGTLLEDQYTFLKIQKHILCSITFFFKNLVSFMI